MSFKMKALVLMFLLAGLPLAARALSPGEVMTPENPAAPTNGYYQVMVEHQGDWVNAGVVECNRFFENQNLDLSALAGTTGPVKVRIVKHGAGLGHLDQVTLGDAAPVAVSIPDPAAPTKLSRLDHDVIEAPQVLDLTFDAAADPTLTVNARIEDHVINKTPFVFPPRDALKGINQHAAFYTYHLGQAVGALKVDGELDRIDHAAPLFVETTRPGSGHPVGKAYAWAMNDGENLYVAFDFTSDNTMDGDVDYAAVHIKTAHGEREFKVSVPEQEWGVAGFTYTDQVDYQHKVYEFQIPLAEIDLADAPPGAPVPIAMTAYGTALPIQGQRVPAMAYNTNNHSSLLTFEKENGGVYDLQGMIVKKNSTVEFPIAGVKWAGLVRSPATFDKTTNRFMVVYGPTLAGEIRGQLIQADGTLYDQNGNQTPEVDLDSILIDNGNGYFPDVAFDSDHGKYLVVWETSATYEIMGQFISRNGQLDGGPFKVRSVLGSAEALSPAVAYDHVNQRFLVVFYYTFGSGDFIVGGQFVQYRKGPVTIEGVAGEQLLGIGSAPPFLGSLPAITWNARADRFMVAWPGMDGDLYGQMLDGDANIRGARNRTTPDLVISNAPGDQVNPAVINNYYLNEFIVAWADYRNADVDVYGQRINYHAKLKGNSSERNFAFADELNDQEFPALSYLGNIDHPILAYDDGITGTSKVISIQIASLPPSEPYLVHPADGQDGVGSSVRLSWFTAHDPYGKKFHYNVYVCDNVDPQACVPTTVVAQNDEAPTRTVAHNSLPLAASLVVGMGLMLGGVGRSRKVKVLLVALALTVAFTLGSCLWEPPEDEKVEDFVNFRATGLLPGTTYYWQVVSENAAAHSDSEIRSFTTK